MSKAEYGTGYSGKAGQCAFDETKTAGSFKNGGMVQEKYISNEKMKSIVAKQPVSSGIVVTEKMRMYHSGIMTDDFLDCSTPDKEINHAVTVVGYGKTDRKNVESSWCSEYWIARNSWGT